MIHTMLQFTEAVTVDGMTEQNELVPVDQGKDEGDDQLKRWELTKEPHPAIVTKSEPAKVSPTASKHTQDNTWYGILSYNSQKVSGMGVWNLLNYLLQLCQSHHIVGTCKQ